MYFLFREILWKYATAEKNKREENIGEGKKRGKEIREEKKEKEKEKEKEKKRGIEYKRLLETKK